MPEVCICTAIGTLIILLPQCCEGLFVNHRCSHVLHMTEAIDCEPSFYRIILLVGESSFRSGKLFAKLHIVENDSANENSEVASKETPLS